MNGDLISRSMLLENLELLAKFQPEYKQSTILGVCATIRATPAVDAEPVRHERWAHLGGDEWCCSGCGEVIHTEGSWERPTKKYCHECGAKMDGDNDG